MVSLHTLFQLSLMTGGADNFLLLMLVQAHAQIILMYLGIDDLYKLNSYSPKFPLLLLLCFFNGHIISSVPSNIGTYQALKYCTVKLLT